MYYIVKRKDTAHSSNADHIDSNSVVTISRLPPEILSEIFIFTAIASVKTNDNEIETFTPRWIESTSHVCQYWRNTALGCPELWSGIIFSHKNWAEEMLERSKTMPLVIRATVTCKSVFDRVQLALSHLSRIRELRLQVSGDDMRSLLDTIVYKDAPKLEYLRLTRYTKPWGPFGSLDFRTSLYILPDSSFESAKTLHRLELRDCAIRWTSPLLSGLRHFSLCRPVSLFSPSPTVAQFMDALELMSNLETLEIEDGLPLVTSKEWPSDRIINLTRLSRISLKARVWDCIDVLDHISYPRSTALAIASDNAFSYEDALDFMPRLFKNIQTEAETPLRCLKLVNMSPQILKLILWTNDAGPAFPPPLDTAKINICLSRCPMRLEPLITELSRVTPLYQLRTVHISLALEKNPVDWLPILQSLNSIQNICLSGQGTLGIITTLLVDMRESAPEEKADILLPDLQSIVLKCVELFNPDSNDERYPGYFELDYLREFLIRRYEIGAEITQLKLYGSDLKDGQIELLREIVVDARVARIHPDTWVDIPCD